MKKIGSKGFAAVEAVVVLIVLLVIIGIGIFVFSRMSSSTGTPAEQAKDAVVAENLKRAKDALGDYVTENKTIPSTVGDFANVSYSREDNQTAKLCATFVTAQAGSSVKLGLWDKLRGKASNIENTHEVYRDNVDFGRHAKGRNCYKIGYAPINEAYDQKYASKKKNHKVCDALRQYHGKFTGQTIKGFFIGGTFTTNPGTAGGRAVLAQDADAYDSACNKIAISELKVGDKVEMFIEDGPANGSERVYFVKAIKKTQ